jgi:hypothetical protein
VATKAHIDSRQRKWLLRLSGDVARRCRQRNELAQIVFYPPSSLKADATDSEGWCVEIGRLRPDRGSGLQLWLDMWPSRPSRKLYMCYKGSTPEQIAKAAKAGSKLFGPAIPFTDSAWHYDQTLGYSCLKKPLPREAFGKPIVELYQRRDSWSFYGVYVWQAGKFHRSPSEVLTKRVADFLETVGRAVLAQIGTEVQVDQDFIAVENRRKVAQHLRRDRSPTLAKMAKLRDGFTCQVCDFNFEQLYGKLGRGFAEAHHRVSLSTLKTSSDTQVKELVTVCANCHRMLHHMGGKASDVASLRRIVSSHQ